MDKSTHSLALHLGCPLNHCFYCRVSDVWSVVNKKELLPSKRFIVLSVEAEELETAKAMDLPEVHYHFRE